MGKRIFVIEDDRDIGVNLKEILESEGYEIEIATNGKEALDKLRGNLVIPSLILLDIMMPVMDGYQFRNEQEADIKLSSIPVIVMTADGNIAAKTQQLRAKAYLRKPIDIDHLINMVAKHAA